MLIFGSRSHYRPSVVSGVGGDFSHCLPLFRHPYVVRYSIRRSHFAESLRPAFTHSYADAGTTNSMPPRDRIYGVGDFMTKKDDLHVVKTYTTVEEALETLVEKRITGFPVIDDDWKLVGVVSDYDLLALDSISGTFQVLKSELVKVSSHSELLLYLLANQWVSSIHATNARNTIME